MWFFARVFSKSRATHLRASIAAIAARFVRKPAKNERSGLSVPANGCRSGHTGRNHRSRWLPTVKTEFHSLVMQRPFSVTHSFCAMAFKNRKYSLWPSDCIDPHDERVDVSHGKSLARLLLGTYGPAFSWRDFDGEPRNGSCNQHKYCLNPVRARPRLESRKYGAGDATPLFRQANQQRSR